MLIRAATAEDVPLVLPMVRSICDLHEARDPERFGLVSDAIDQYAWWLPQRARDPRSVFLVAERPAGWPGGRLAAFTVGTVEPDVSIFRVGEFGWLHDLWVEPDARRGGVARGLVEAAVARFAALGVSQVRLQTGVFNVVAREAFGAMGFRACVVELVRVIGTGAGIGPAITPDDGSSDAPDGTPASG